MDMSKLKKTIIRHEGKKKKLTSVPRTSGLLGSVTTSKTTD